jgi:hypothetical protein
MIKCLVIISAEISSVSYVLSPLRSRKSLKIQHPLTASLAIRAITFVQYSKSTVRTAWRRERGEPLSGLGPHNDNNHCFPDSAIPPYAL